MNICMKWCPQHHPLHLKTNMKGFTMQLLCWHTTLKGHLPRNVKTIDTASHPEVNIPFLPMMRLVLSLHCRRNFSWTFYGSCFFDFFPHAKVDCESKDLASVFIVFCFETRCSKDTINWLLIEHWVGKKPGETLEGKRFSCLMYTPNLIYLRTYVYYIL